MFHRCEDSSEEADWYVSVWASQISVVESVMRREGIYKERKDEDAMELQP